MKILSCCIVFLLAITVLQGYELLSLADVPTAGILQQGEVLITTKMYRNNGILLGSSVGLFPRFMFGISYGGENIVGNEKPDWHEKVEVLAKYRILDESPTMPAIVLGFDSRGHGVYHSSMKRFDIKSKGFYTVVSRNYLFLGNLGMHAGANYSMENKDKQDKINFFTGIDKSLGNELTLMIEYDLALNDKNPEHNDAENSANFLKRKGRGYLNLALYFRFTDFLALKLTAYDILENSQHTIGADRAITINYNMKF